MESLDECMYDFKNIKGLDTSSIFSVDQNMHSVLDGLNLKQKQWLYNDDTYHIIRYNKPLITSDNYDTSGWFRSVIHKNGKMVCFAPPKSMDYMSFKEKVDLSMISIEEYVEGTMINMFWSGKEWEIATRSSVGGKVSFFVNTQKTFRQMFLEAINYNETGTETDFFTSLEKIPHNTCLSFVLQHPDNRIVVPFEKPSIYLVKAYTISEDYIVREVNLSTISQKLPNWIRYSNKNQYSLQEVESILQDGSVHFTYTKVGLVLYGVDKTTGNVVRTKIRNTNYEYVRKLRGNQPKLQYRYLMLRKENKIKEYLTFYPEHKGVFNTFRNNVHTFTHSLYRQYVSCFIHKQNPLKTFSMKYRTHMYKLHELYIMNKKKITLVCVMEYVNNLHPTLLMHSINYRNHTDPV